ncbi:MAG: undecaprenyl-diphosphate phosphatase [Nanobdellota archaeon]
MDIIQAILLGILQGITEWLPISSSGHLVIFQEMMGLKDMVAFDIVLHLASLLVILFAFRKRIYDLVSGVIRLQQKELYFAFKLFVATIPIAFVGVFFNDLVKSAFSNPFIVGLSLLATSVILFSVYFSKKNNKRLSAVNASIMGVAQAFAILPGVSRSGITISAGLLLGVKKGEAAFFSFMMFIPAIIGAAVFEISSIKAVPELSSLLVGFIAAFISGYLSLKLLIKLIMNNKFWVFGFYCLGLGLLLLFI